MIKRILLGLGGTRFTPVATKRAVELAKKYDSQITGVTAVDALRIMQGSPGDAQETRSERQREQAGILKQRIDESISQFESACIAAGIKHKVHCELSDPFRRMSELARFHDLMIFGLRSLFDYDFGVEPRNAMARLVAQGVQPIIAVSDTYRDVQRVLLAYSGSPKSAAAIKRFIQLQFWPEAALRIVTCGRPDEAERLLAEAAEYCELHGRQAEVYHARGKPQDLIPQQAEEWEADLVVLGTSTETLVCDDNWANSESTLAGLLVRQAVGTTLLHLIKNASRAFFLSH
jgi:nucleotide-binding universal stress UspA family protein